MQGLQRIVKRIRPHVAEVLRFGIVGVVTFGINFAAFSLFYGLLHHHYQIAVSLAFVVTVCCHFLLNKVFTFAAHTQNHLSAAPRYGAMLVLNYGITLLVSWVTVDLIGVSPYFVVVASAACTAVSSFFIMKFFVFRADSTPVEAARTVSNGNARVARTG